MGLVLKIAIILSLIKILETTGKPLICAGIYAAAVFLITLALGTPIMPAIIGTLISFVLGYIYFWLLDRTEGSFLWWVIMVLGVFIGLV